MFKEYGDSMSTDMFAITSLDILSWITFGFIVGLLVHAIKPSYSSRHIYKDLILATLGSMVGGLTIVFFYGYTLLGLLIISIVGGIIAATGYVWIEMRNQQVLKNNAEHL